VIVRIMFLIVASFRWKHGGNKQGLEDAAMAHIARIIETARPHGAPLLDAIGMGVLMALIALGFAPG
jgi:hypothetical protein